jgi:hypothetical protein
MTTFRRSSPLEKYHALDPSTKELHPAATRDGETKKCKEVNFCLYINICKKNTCVNSCIYVRIYRVHVGSKHKRGKVSSQGDPGS